MSEKYPGVSTILNSPGGSEASIGERGVAVPVTIAFSEGRYGVSGTPEELTGPRLYARRTASPYKALPFFSNAAMTDVTNTTNFVCDVPDAMAKRFKVGDLVTFYDQTTGLLAANTADVITVDAVGAAGSGTAGAGFTLITCTGEVFTTVPVATDLLVLADGTHLSKNVLLVEGAQSPDGSTDLGSNGFVSGAFKKSAVENKAYFVESEAPELQLLDLV